MRDSPALTIIPLLQDIVWCKDAYEVANGAEVLVIITEWNEFRALDLTRIADTMKSKRLLDLRNIYKREDMVGKGFHYSSIGRPDVVPESGAREKIRSVS